MSRRDDHGKFAARPATWKLVTSWVISVLSLMLLWASAKWVFGDFGSFRSCNNSSDGITIASCGKSSVNLGDLMLIVLFVLIAFFALSVCTYAVRLTRRTLP